MPDDAARGAIHDENPFTTPAELRDPARRFRGRLATGVTVFTTGALPRATGLTVSSLLVAQGERDRILALLDVEPAEDIRAAARFVVHVLPERERTLSDRFAGMRPSPGGLFHGLEVHQTEYGPVLDTIGTRALCTWERSTDMGYHTLIVGVIDRIELEDLDAPLVYYRGRYRRLDRPTDPPSNE
jgi:3-hydroxy-9,10-secoandrosta-1,3,5(10)-triene-9,17-dione monooxygenase reductase component